MCRCFGSHTGNCTGKSQNPKHAIAKDKLAYGYDSQPYQIVSDLLCQTSGLADIYEEGKTAKKNKPERTPACLAISRVLVP